MGIFVVKYIKVERVGDRRTTDDILNRKTEDDFRSRLECTVETPLFSGG